MVDFNFEREMEENFEMPEKMPIGIKVLSIAVTTIIVIVLLAIMATIAMVPFVLFKNVFE